MSAQGKAASHGRRPAPRRFEHLDMLRGGAALLVLIGHVRGFVFMDYGQLPTRTLLAAPIYAIGGLGHQAVILFFALSGFLVGGRAMREIRGGTWQFGDYATHRFARLWTALLPALLVTALLDWVGRDLLHLVGYRGEYLALLSSGPQPDAPADTSPVAFLGNLAFLQGIVVPVFGTNGPLWSLANEFWYYFLIPFAWLALAGRFAGTTVRILAGLVAAILLAALPASLVALGSIWIFGAAAWSMQTWLLVRTPRARNIILIGIAAMILATNAWSLARPGMASDVTLGLACAAALPCLAQLSNPGRLYGRIAFALSEISFTLYVVHFPLIALLWFALLAPYQFAVEPAGFLVAGLLIFAALSWATAMWWLFERNTPFVRRRMLAVLGIKGR